MAVPPSGTKVLVVDDDKMFCHVIRSYLEEIGLSATVLHSGTGVVDKVREGFDIVLLDMYMARETGVDVLIAIKDAFPNLPVIVMTGFSSNELRQTTASLGACEFLNKPFQMTALRDKIATLVSGDEQATSE